jgi:hypothetical protein
MAVELCKVALWIEAVDPGKPLSFLDAHIQCGDSLVGVFDPKVLEQGIPDEAYKPLTGDDKPTCTSLKKENASFRKAGQKGTLQTTLNLQTSPPISRSQQRLQEIEAMPETTLAEGSAKQAAYEAWEQERSSDPQTLAADLYTAAFFLPKTKESRAKVPTSEHLLLLQSGQEIPGDLELTVEEASRDFRFFHWHLRFGEVMEKGGFDCVLGNPPWEVTQLREKEFFAGLSIGIASLNGEKRKLAVRDLRLQDPSAWDKYVLAKRESESWSEFCRSGAFPLCARGKINAYQVFAEQALNLLSCSGRGGVIVPTGIATDDGTKAFFEHITTKGLLVSLYDFENKEALFKGVHRSYKFSLLTLGSGQSKADFVFFATRTSHLSDDERHFSLGADEIRLINPNTRTCPVFRTCMDSEIVMKVYRAHDTLVSEEKNNQAQLWPIGFHSRFFNMTEDSSHFEETSQAGRVSLYEAKQIHQYDHRWATYDSNCDCRDATLQEKQEPAFVCKPRYWVDSNEVLRRLKNMNWRMNWLLGWRRITNATNERTCIASVIPFAAVGHTISLLFPQVAPNLGACLVGNLNCIPLDYIARNKIGGTDLTVTYLGQLPVLSSSFYDDKDIDYIVERVLELTYTAHDLKPWAEDLGYNGPPFIFDPERRALLRAELDAFYAHLYGLTRDELRYILDPADVMGPDYPSETFRVLKTNELRQFGEYRTQRLVLEAWDRLFGGR